MNDEARGGSADAAPGKTVWRAHPYSPATYKHSRIPRRISQRHVIRDADGGVALVECGIVMAARTDAGTLRYGMTLEERGQTIAGASDEGVCRRCLAVIRKRERDAARG